MWQDAQSCTHKGAQDAGQVMGERLKSGKDVEESFGLGVRSIWPWMQNLSYMNFSFLIWKRGPYVKITASSQWFNEMTRKAAALKLLGVGSA